MTDSGDEPAIEARIRALSEQVDRLLVEREALTAELHAAGESVVRWRSAALQRWNATATGGYPNSAQQEIDAMRNTVSWRVTKPLRAVRRRLPTSGSGG